MGPVRSLKFLVVNIVPFLSLSPLGLQLLFSCLKRDVFILLHFLSCLFLTRRIPSIRNEESLDLWENHRYLCFSVLLESALDDI